MTLLLPIPLSCRAPACLTLSCHINGALLGENKSTRRQREEKLTHERERERGGGAIHTMTALMQYLINMH